MTMLSPRFDHALGYASQLHRSQKRKGTEIAYVSHLLSTSAIALEHGATEDEAIAALLHDAIEDQGREGATRFEIGVHFGAAVLKIVEACSDAEGGPGQKKAPWKQRKEKYIRHLRTADASTRLVSASDKLHNARTILADLRIHGNTVWTRFKGKKAGSLWYYRTLITTFRKAGASDTAAMKRLIDELDRTVTELETLANAPRKRA